MSNRTLFQTEVDLDYEGKSGKTQVHWTAELELRSWGIKSIDILVPAQVIHAELEIENEEGESFWEKASFEIETAYCLDAEKTPMCPSDLIFKNGKWVLQF